MKAVHVPASQAEQEKVAGEWGSQVWLANKSLTGASLAVTRLIYRPAHSGEKHRHPNADEVIYLIRGKACIHMPDEQIELHPGDGLTIPAGLVHRIENVGNDDVEMTIAYSSGDRRYVAE